jgi:hypothetical protein
MINTEEKKKSPPQKALVVDIALTCDYFQTTDGRTYASVPVDGQTVPMDICGMPFLQWLCYSLYERHGQVATSTVLSDCVAMLRSRTRYQSARSEICVHTRTASHNGKIYVDLGNSTWNCIEIDAEGWRVVDKAPVLFTRSANMAPLPMPVPGGTLDEIRPLVNVATDDDWILFASYLVMALNPWGPYPIMMLVGEQGSSKSVLAELVKRLLDPSLVSRQVNTSDRHALMIAATKAQILVLDNLSSVNNELSDLLCCISTGGSFNTRALYTNDEEHIIQAKKPLILNGIGDFSTRPDLLDRAVMLHLPAISPKSRMTEREFWSRFNGVKRRVLGAVFDGMSAALKSRESDIAFDLPRMADFVRWAFGAGRQFGFNDSQLRRAFECNQQRGVDDAIESSSIGIPLLKLASQGQFIGTASELLDKLAAIVGSISAAKQLPRPRSLRSELRRILPALRQSNITVVIDYQRSNRGRLLMVEPTGPETISLLSNSACCDESDECDDLQRA